MEALHAYNRTSKSWCIPKKGSPDYRACRALQQTAENKAMRVGRMGAVLWSKKKFYERRRPVKRGTPSTGRGRGRGGGPRGFGVTHAQRERAFDKWAAGIEKRSKEKAARARGPKGLPPKVLTPSTSPTYSGYKKPGPTGTGYAKGYQPRFDPATGKTIDPNYKKATKRVALSSS